MLLTEMGREVKNYATSIYPKKAGKIGLQFIEGNFRKQAWEGIPWKRRKGGPRNKGRALLVLRGILRRGNKMRTAPGQAILYNEIPYAKAHNEGFTGPVAIKEHMRRLYGKYRVSSIKSRRTYKKKLERGKTTVKAHTRKVRIPRRQFAPTATRPSPTLQKKVTREVTLDLYKILKRNR